MGNHDLQTPLARQDELLDRTVDNDVVLYDLRTDEAHLLPGVAGAVWRAADGRRSVAELAELIAPELGDRGPTVVWAAMGELHERGLLDGELVFPAAPSGMTRRDMLRRIGIGAAMVPVITTVLAAPAAAVSGTCGAGAVSCTATSDCTGNAACVVAGRLSCCGQPGNRHCSISNNNNACN